MSPVQASQTIALITTANAVVLKGVQLAPFKRACVQDGPTADVAILVGRSQTAAAAAATTTSVRNINELELGRDNETCTACRCVWGRELRHGGTE